MFNKEEKKVAEDVSNSSNIIGKGTLLTGNIETHGNLRIEGKVVGDIKTKNKVVLGQSSQVEGNVLSANAEIAGEVRGTVEVTEVLILKPTAMIDGDIVTNKLVVESGATFNGGCKMGVSAKNIELGSEKSRVKENTPKTTAS